MEKLLPKFRPSPQLKTPERDLSLAEFRLKYRLGESRAKKRLTSYEETAARKRGEDKDCTERMD